MAEALGYKMNMMNCTSKLHGLVACMILSCAGCDKKHEPAEKKLGADCLYDEIGQSYINSLKKAQGEYRTMLATYIEDHADRIEVFVLKDFVLMEDEALLLRMGEGEFEVIPSGTFEITPFGQSLFYDSKTTLDKDSMGDLPAIMAEILRSPSSKSGGDGFKPTYGINIYSGDELLLSTSICKEIPNFYVTYPSYTNEYEIVYDLLSIDEGHLEDFLSFVQRIESQTKPNKTPIRTSE